MAVGLLEATVEISFGEELPTPLLNQIQAAFVGREPVSIRFCLGSIFGKQMVTQYNNCLILSVNVTAYSVQATPTVLHLEFKGVPF
jgi:hypothetical protein